MTVDEMKKEFREKFRAIEFAEKPIGVMFRDARQDVEAFWLTKMAEKLESLPTGMFDSTPYKEAMIAEIRKEF